MIARIDWTLVLLFVLFCGVLVLYAVRS